MNCAGSDRAWMRRAVRLASTCLGTTWPNPGVGCVLVRDDRLLGAGITAPWTPEGAQEHAEAAALRTCLARGHDPRGATAYVTLAPCTHRSRPGQMACAQALIAAGIARVVVAVEDPHQPDSRAAFLAAGIRWESGLEADLAQHLHGGFLTRMTQGRPRFTGKWAATLDGFLATATGHSAWISSPEALALSRRRRRAFDGILVGSGTAVADDPQLLASSPRPGGRRGPLRIVVGDPRRLSPGSRLLATIRQAPLLMVHGPDVPEAVVNGLAAQGAELLALDDPRDVRELGAALGRRGLNDVLVEGGAGIHGAFLNAGLYDRLELYHGARSLGGGLAIARGNGAVRIPEGQRWQPEGLPRLLGDSVRVCYRRADPLR